MDGATLDAPASVIEQKNLIEKVIGKKGYEKSIMTVKNRRRKLSLWSLSLSLKIDKQLSNVIVIVKPTMGFLDHPRQKTCHCLESLRGQ